MNSPLNKFDNQYSTERLQKSSAHPVNFSNENSRASENISVVNKVSLQDVARQRFADLILATWPYDTKNQAAAFLSVSPETVDNWLKSKTSANIEHIFAIGALRGVFFVMEVMTLGQSRQVIFKSIIQKVKSCVARK